jgi:hypothetical protein
MQTATLGVSTLFFPQILRPVTVKARGWGLGVALQNHEHPKYGFSRTMRTFEPMWWHNWWWHVPGCTPAIYSAHSYGDEREHIKQDCNDWAQVLLMSEPELEYSAPEDVAALVRDMQTYAPHVAMYGFGLVASTDLGLDWLDQYKRIGPKVDGYHWHAYMESASDWQTVWDKIRFHSEGKPVVLTEFAAWPSKGDTAQFKVMDAVANTMDTDSQLEAVAWFCARPKESQLDWMPCSLLDENGNITAIGMHWLKIAQEWHRSWR